MFYFDCQIAKNKKLEVFISAKEQRNTIKHIQVYDFYVY